MLKILTKTLIFIALMACSILSVAAKVPAFDRVYAFGDSLSDNGNLYKIRKGKEPASPPYYRGRFSNGPVWVEDLTDKLGLQPNALVDYAIGGAQTKAWIFPSNHLNNQIKRFANQHDSASPTALYTVWIGANNYFFHPNSSDKRVHKTVNQIVESIDTLAGMGAKVFIVPNLPDLGKTPMARKQQAKKHDGYDKKVSHLSQLHNQLLKPALAELATRDNITIIQLDTNKLFNDAIASPKAFEVTNVTEPCYQGNFKGKPKNSTICTHPNHYIFWDIAHPTARIHREIAQYAYAGLQSSLK